MHFTATQQLWQNRHLVLTMSTDIEDISIDVNEDASEITPSVRIHVGTENSGEE